MNGQDSTLRAGARLAIPRGEGLLRLALKLDAVVTGANGAAYLAAAGLLDSPLGVPAGLLRTIGAFLLVFAAVVWTVGSRPTVNRAAVGVVIAANLLWVVGSVALAAFGWFSPATVGSVWAIAQALVVAGFAALQYEGLRSLD